MNKCKEKYYYKFTYIECPVCGSEQKYKERVKGERPEDPTKRYEYIQRYDWCNEWSSL